MTLQGRIDKRINKEGKEYEVLIVTFPNGYEKMVFLENAEKYMVKTLESKNK